MEWANAGSLAAMCLLPAPGCCVSWSAGSQCRGGITAAHLSLWAVLAFGVLCEQPALDN